MQLDKTADAGLSGLIENYIRQFFEDRNVSPANQKQLWQHYNDTLAKGLDLGYNPSPEMYDPKLAHSLKYDVARFSAFKETSFRKQLESALTKDGKIVPWSEFKKTANVLSGDYNKRWLKTEYNHTVATANMAEQWQDFEAEKDLYPNLKYVTAGDGRVREAHKILDGVILPIDHPFWKSHTTPLDWGCRCNIEQSDDEPSKVIPSYKVKEEFQNNAFYSGKVFNGSAYESGMSLIEKKVVDDFTTEMMHVKVYNPLVLKELKSGGKILQSELVNTALSDYPDVFKCCEHFAEKGSICEILPTVDFDSPLYKEIYGDLIGTKFERKCPDFRIDSLFYELEGFDISKNTNPVTTLKNMLSRGMKQSNKIIIKDCGVTRSFMQRNIKNRIFLDKQDIQEVWMIDAKGKLENVYNAKTS